jgi:hypothetical protein
MGRNGGFVYDPHGKPIGTIRHLVIEKASGRVTEESSNLRTPWAAEST